MLSGLAQLNIELSSACDKTHLCPMCGHQDQAINPIQYGEIDFELLRTIREQISPGITISFHRDGEPTAYSRLSDALQLFAAFTVSIVTHGLNLGRRADDIIGHASTVTISVFRGDADAETQLRSIRTFMGKKGHQSPQVQIKIVGDFSEEELRPYAELGVRIIRRLIHVPISNAKYAHRLPTVPEVGICLDALHRPSIAHDGRMYLCNRLDPSGHTYIGDVTRQSLDDIWNGEIRHRMIEAHKLGRRDLANDLCKTCLHWGTPSQ